MLAAGGEARALRPAPTCNHLTGGARSHERDRSPDLLQTNGVVLSAGHGGERRCGVPPLRPWGPRIDCWSFDSDKLLPAGAFETTHAKIKRIRDPVWFGGNWRKSEGIFSQLVVIYQAARLPPKELV